MPSQNGAVAPANCTTRTLRITFSMPSPVELTQLNIQYHRKVGTESASNRIELGATAPAAGSTSSASTFLSVTASRLREWRPREDRRSGWHGGAGCARAAHGPRQERAVPSG